MKRHNLFFVAVSTLLCLCPPALFAGTYDIQRFAVIAGANVGGKTTDDLKYATSDAKRIRDVLVRIGGMREENLSLLLNPEKESLANSLAFMRTKVEKSRRPGAQVQFFFYYSGHSDERGLLLYGEYFDYRTLRDALAAIGADVRIVILDSCSSGAFTREKGGSMAPPFLFDESASVEGHAYLTSSTAEEVSQESDRLESSFFTSALLNGLRGAADANEDGTVTLHEAYQYAYDRTLSDTERSRSGAQHPAFDIKLNGKGSFVITDLRAGGAVLFLPKGLSGKVSLRDVSDHLVFEVRKISGTEMRLGIEDGYYRILLENEGTLSETTLVVDEKKEYEVRKDLFHGIKATEAAIRGIIGAVKSPVTLFPFGMSFVSEESGSSFYLNLIGGKVGSVDGIMTSLLFNNSIGTSSGYQGALFSNSSGGDFYGFQGSLGVNMTSGDVFGLQTASFFNSIGGNLKGFQIGAVNHVESNGKLVQIGAVNMTGGDALGFQGAFGANLIHGDLLGLQTSLLLNEVGGDLDGIQFSTFNRVGGDARLAQIGGVNLVAGEGTFIQLGGYNQAGRAIRGAQVGVVNLGRSVNGIQAGLFNYSEKQTGLQIGLINVSRELKGFPIGLVDIQFNGENHIDEVLETQAERCDDLDKNLFATTYFRFGSRYFYKYFDFGFLGFADEEETGYPPFMAGAGLGFRLPLFFEGFALHLDGGANYLSASERLELVEDPDFLQKVVPQFRLFAICKLFRNAGLMAGFKQWVYTRNYHPGADAVSGFEIVTDYGVLVVDSSFFVGIQL